MSAKTADDLLPAVRLYVLESAAVGYTSIQLSSITFAVDAPAVLGNPQAKRVTRRHVWHGAGLKVPSKLGHRGWVQACLSKLAKEGLMWERQKPEPGRFRGERCDKFFRIRIKQEDAIAKLKKMGVKPPVALKEREQPSPWFPSYHMTKSLKG